MFVEFVDFVETSSDLQSDRYQYMILLPNYFRNARSYIWESQNAFCTEDYNTTALTIEACCVSDGPGH